MEIDPHWQKGYRVHGYWLGKKRIGYVALSPRGYHPVIVTWSIDLPSGTVEGTCQNAQVGKRLVESVYKKHINSADNAEE